MPEALALQELPKILEWNTTTVGVTMGFGKEPHNAAELRFTGQIYLYSEREVPEECKDRLVTEAKPQEHRLVFRGPDYAAERANSEKTLGVHIS